MRKSFLLPIVSLLALQASAQSKTVRIHGSVTDTSVKSIELTHPADATLTKWTDTKVPIVNGVFSTSIGIPFPAQISVTNGMMAYRYNFISDDAEIRIDADGKLKITGSAAQEEYEKEFVPFFAANDRIFDSLQAFYRDNYPKYGRDFPKPTRDNADRLIDSYYAGRGRLLSAYIRRHPDSYVALWDINYLATITPAHKYFDFDQLFSSFSPEMQQRSFIPLLREKIRAAAQMQVGQPFPTAFFKGYEEVERSLRANNRYYLVDFWFSHCAPCAREFPKLRSIYDQFRAKGFDIVSISVDKSKSKEDYLAAIKKYQLTWSQVWDRDGVNAEKFSIHSFPTYVLLDKDGRIVNANIQVHELEAFLKERL